MTMYHDRNARTRSGKGRTPWVAPTVTRLQAGSAELTIGTPFDASNKS